MSQAERIDDKTTDNVINYSDLHRNHSTLPASDSMALSGGVSYPDQVLIYGVFYQTDRLHMSSAAAASDIGLLHYTQNG